MKIKCPSCHAVFDLVAALDSDAGRELMIKLAKLDSKLSRPLTAYLALFRAPKRALSWDRALKLTDDILPLAEPERLALALTNTVESLRQKQAQGSWKPLRNHNYLKQVINSTQIDPVGYLPTQQTAAVPPQAQSKTAKGLASIWED